MRRNIMFALMGAFVMSASADITVNVSPGIGKKDFSVEYGYIADMVKPRAERPESLKSELTVTDGKFVIPTLPDGAAQYVIPTGEREYIMIYTRPGDNITVDLSGISPLKYTVKGTPLMEDMGRLDSQADAVMMRYKEIMEGGNPAPEAIVNLQNEYYRIFKDFIEANPDAEAVPYAILHLEGEDFIKAYGAMTPAAKGSPVAPMADAQKVYVERGIAADKRKVELQSGEYQAPDFTFKTVDGKDVSLSDYRGKWVIIDFWGSWCPWCIKGFPKLKEAYAEFSPELEIIGVACNDKREAWEKALVKYELPWVNVYNPDENGGRLLEDYAVEGFPTKVIVSPDGKIKNITSGENPEFFDILRGLLKK